MDPFLGVIMQFAFGFAPRGWALCNGQMLNIGQNQALYALLGTYYGGNGTTNFQLPDLRGRVPIGFGAGPGLPSYNLGARVGNQSVTLTVANMPEHNHIVVAASEAADAASPNNAYFANTGSKDHEYKTSGTQVQMNQGMMANAGAGVPVSIMQPYTVISYCIALTGVFPPRD